MSSQGTVREEEMWTKPQRGTGKEDLIRDLKKEDHQLGLTKLPSAQLNTFPAQCRNLKSGFQPGREECRIGS